MAGTNSAFNYTAFRSAILTAMRMGSPNTADQQVEFHWNPQQTFSKASPTGKPYVWGDTPATDTTPDPVKVDCAVDAGTNAATLGTSMGEFNPEQRTLYLFKEEYDQIRGADFVLIGGNRYDIKTIEQPYGLFEAEIYPIKVEAVDES